MKTCSTCCKIRPETDFYKRTVAPDGLATRCKECMKDRDRAHGKRYYAENRERCRLRIRRAQLVKNYGVPRGRVSEVLKMQQTSSCEICGRPPGTGRAHHIDHDHRTRTYRGILCHCCNTMLGFARDDPTILQAALKYLVAHQFQEI